MSEAGIQPFLNRLGRNAGRWVAAAGAFSFILRIWLADRFVRTPYYEFTVHVNGPDQNRFMNWAEAIRAGHWTLPGTAPDAPFQFSPVYSWLLSLSLAFRPHPFLPIIILQALLSCWAGWALWDLGRRFGSALGGFAAAMLWFFYAPSIFYDGCLIRESLLASTALLAFWAAVRVWDLPTRTRAVLAGAMLGFSSAIRPHFFAPLLVLVLAALTLRAREPARRRRRLAAAMVLVAAACAVIAPITVRNWTVSRQWVPISVQGADALILGNDPDGPGVGHHPTEVSRRMLEASGNRFSTAVKIIWDVTRQAPDRMRELYLRKLRMLVNDYEIPGNYSFYVWKLLLRPTAWLFLSWGWVFPLACLGAWSALRHGGRENGWKLVLVSALAFLAGAAVIHIQSRYRFAAAPFVVGLAGYGVAGMIRLLKKRHFIRAAAALAGMTVIGWAVQPLPSYGYIQVPGPNGTERLNRDLVQKSDYLTLLVSWSLSGAGAQADAIRLVAHRAVRSYGPAVLTEFDGAMQSIEADPGKVLTQTYLKKYGIRSAASESDQTVSADSPG